MDVGGREKGILGRYISTIIHPPWKRIHKMSLILEIESCFPIIVYFPPSFISISVLVSSHQTPTPREKIDLFAVYVCMHTAMVNVSA